MNAVGRSRGPYAFGDGLRLTTGDHRTFELIPYVGGDGRGEVAGYALAIDQRIRGRYPGPIDGARRAAEGMMGDAYGEGGGGE